MEQEQAIRTISTLANKIGTKPTPEIARVIEEMDKEISYLEESVGLLSQKISPILESEYPSKVENDARSIKNTELGENLQIKIDKIKGLSCVVNQLTERIAL